MLTLEEIRELSPPIPDDFQAFDPRSPVTIYRRNLPHWRQDGATYFVTFRLADSVPQDIWDKLKEEADWWKNLLEQGVALSPTQKRDLEEFQKRSQRVLETTLDQCHGSCDLRRPRSFEIVEAAMHFFDAERYSLYGYVVMPNHCHVLVRPHPDHALEKILQSWKAHTARAIPHEGNPYWHSESHDRIVRDANHYRKTAKYILKNPIKANLWSDFLPIFLKGVLEERAKKFRNQKKEK